MEMEDEKLEMGENLFGDRDRTQKCKKCDEPIGTIDLDFPGFCTFCTEYEVERREKLSEKAYKKEEK